MKILINKRRDRNFFLLLLLLLLLFFHPKLFPKLLLHFIKLFLSHLLPPPPLAALDLSCQALMSINCCMKIFIYPLAHDEYWTSMKSLRNCLRCSTGSGEVKKTLEKNSCPMKYSFSFHINFFLFSFSLSFSLDKIFLCTFMRSSQQIINTSKHLFPTTKADVESLLNYSLNKKRYSTQIPPEARHYRPTLAVPRLQKPSFLSSTSNNSIAPNLSLTPSFTEGFEMNQRVTNRITVERQPSTRSNKSFIPLHLSPSQASLTRSKSLNIQSTMKHSPNCRLNKKF